MFASMAGSAVLGLWLALSGAIETDEKEMQSPRVMMIVPDLLAKTKARLHTGDARLAAALDALRKEADEALQAGPFSVMQKPRVAASGDKHDYLSQGPYYWPDPKKQDGLPYVGRDGQVNPESVNGTDRLAFNRMSAAVETLALAHYFTGDDRYAAHAARLLRTWFLDPATRMNPHLNFGQAVPGKCDGRPTGIIDSRVLVYVVDAVKLLETSPQWSADDRAGMRAWCTAYLDWLLNDKFGREEAAAKNNHGTWCDAQVVALAIFVGRDEVARQTLTTSARQRIATQIEPDGRQPLELARTRSFFYSLVNLRAMFVLATLGDRVGVDLWRYRTDDGRCLQRALDYMAAYADPAQKWPHRSLDLPREELAPFLCQAAAVYGLAAYRQQAIKHLPPDARELRLALVLYAAPGE